MQLSFSMEIVLHENHEFYSPPPKGEQYCYKKGTIVFQKLKSIQWLAKNFELITDVDGSQDLGNIDNFQLLPDGYHIEGEWGKVIVDSAPPELKWE